MKTRLLIITLALLLCGCGALSNNSETEKEDVIYTEHSVDADLGKWGYITKDEVPNDKNEKTTIEIRLPHSMSRKGSGWSGQGTEEDYTKYWSLFDSYIYGGNLGAWSKDVEDNRIENVTKSWFNQTINIMQHHHGYEYKNFELDITDQEVVKVNEYDMIKHKGYIRGNLEEEDIEYEFVSYTVQLKSNGAYVYWYMIDTTDDSSLKQIIERDALWVAITFKEITDVKQ